MIASSVLASQESWDGRLRVGQGAKPAWPMSTGNPASLKYGLPSAPTPTNPAASFSVFFAPFTMILPCTYGASSGPSGAVGDRVYVARNGPLRRSPPGS